MANLRSVLHMTLSMCNKKTFEGYHKKNSHKQNLQHYPLSYLCVFDIKPSKLVVTYNLIFCREQRREQRWQFSCTVRGRQRCRFSNTMHHFCLHGHFKMWNKKSKHSYNSTMQKTKQKTRHHGRH